MLRSESSKATSSEISKTSSQRQRDLIIAQQRREEIDRQKEATLRLAKQKQQLELVQQELELQKLRKEQALRVDELEEENRRKLAEATLVEMELREDFSDYNADFHERLSRLGASREEKELARINDWVNNSPSGVETEVLPSIRVQATIATTDTLEFQPTPQSSRRRCRLCSGSRSTKNTGSESHDDDSESDNPKPSFAAAATSS